MTPSEHAAKVAELIKSRLGDDFKGHLIVLSDYLNEMEYGELTGETCGLDFHRRANLALATILQEAGAGEVSTVIIEAAAYRKWLGARDNSPAARAEFANLQA